jgi:RimJ/RimL family protein N-acetyltransferase
MIPQDPWFPVRTERLVLRPFREADFDDVHAYASDPEVARFMEWGPNTPDQTREFMDRILAQQQTWPRAAVNLAAEHLADRRVIGSIRLAVVEEANRICDIGYSFARRYWRQGLCSEAARALLEIAFGPLGAHRVFAECDRRNVGSYGVMEKLGMRREAAFLESRLIKGAWTDRYQYAILDREWSSR